jgi:hypothetical protein
VASNVTGGGTNHPVPNNGACRDLLANLLHGMAGLELHEEVQQDAEQDHRDDDQSADPVSQRERNRAGHQKDDHERIAEEADEAQERREAPLLDEAVWAMETKSPHRSERDAPPS